MRRPSSVPGLRPAAALAAALMVAAVLLRSSLAQQEQTPAFVIVERVDTTGPESIQEDYGKLARDILPKYGARYLARSRQNVLLEGDGGAPCCMALLQFPSLEAATRWYNSPDNQAATKIRQSGARFRLVAIEGLSNQK